MQRAERSRSVMGVGGIQIAVGKLAVYTAAPASTRPRHPGVLDVAPTTRDC